MYKIDSEDIDNREKKGNTDILYGARIHEHPGNEQYNIDDEKQKVLVLCNTEHGGKSLLGDLQIGHNPREERGARDDNHDPSRVDSRLKENAGQFPQLDFLEHEDPDDERVDNRNHR